MQPYVFGIVGLSGTDRLTVIERLIPELARRGYRVGTLRSDPAENGSWRHNGAGAHHLLASLPVDVNLVLAEGFPHENWPKLEVHRGNGPILCQGDPWLVAVAGPTQPRGCPTPWYHWDEIAQIANVIESARSLGKAVR